MKAPPNGTEYEFQSMPPSPVRYSVPEKKSVLGASTQTVSVSRTVRTAEGPTLPIPGGVAFNQLPPPSTVRSTPPLSFPAMPQPSFSSWKLIQTSSGEATTGSAGGRRVGVGVEAEVDASVTDGFAVAVLVWTGGAVVLDGVGKVAPQACRIQARMISPIIRTAGRIFRIKRSPEGNQDQGIRTVQVAPPSVVL